LSDLGTAHLTPGPHAVREGVVSVVLVNYRGADDTIVCLNAFDDVDWPADKLELIVVDNHSGDGQAERIADACPSARVIRSGANLGFAGGCNVGVDHAEGEYVAFLNNDARPGRRWIAAAVEAMEADRSIRAVASKVLDWDGERVDYVDGSLAWFGMGYKREAERPDDGSYEIAHDVLFGTGAAFFIVAEDYRELGGFDERFFMFYEDVDLGWRLNLLGRRVRYVPESVAYHKHHVTMRKFGNYRETYLLERNALLAMVKNYSDETLALVLPSAMALSVRRTTDMGGLDPAAFRDVPLTSSVDVPKLALSGAYGIDYLATLLESMWETRRELQAKRVRTDAELFPLFRKAIEPAYPLPRYLSAHADLVKAFDLDRYFEHAPRILVVTGEPLSGLLAGPAIRAWEMSVALSESHPVRLVSTTGVEGISHERFEIHYSPGEDLLAHTAWADVIVFQGFVLEAAWWLVDSDKIIVADVYDPMHLEQLEQAKDLGEDGRRAALSEVTVILNRQLARADFMLCASAKQRDFWLGQLAPLGRVNALTMGSGTGPSALIDVVPFGLPDEPPVQHKHGIRGVVPGIGPNDKVVIWGGGVYNWFDPLTLIRAIDRLAKRHPDVRLYFMGLKHPNPGVPDMRIAWETQQLAEKLGLVGRHVFFNSGWVPYAERSDHLLDADVGVSTHFDHVETEFSFRTRILDYLWTGLPIVATRGDSFGDILDSEGIGRGVPAEDVDALEKALEEMLYDEAAAAEARANVARYAQQFRWSRVLQPLMDFAAAPHRAADHVLVTPIAANVPPPAGRPNLAGYVSVVARSLRSGGVRELSRRARGFVVRRWPRGE
jgi:GT2 family glycosyltransferase/glycosyltransferase involved in cell wall biosynthesis